MRGSAVKMRDSQLFRLNGSIASLLPRRHRTYGMKVNSKVFPKEEGIRSWLVVPANSTTRESRRTFSRQPCWTLTVLSASPLCRNWRSSGLHMTYLRRTGDRFADPENEM